MNILAILKNLNNNYQTQKSFMTGKLVSDSDCEYVLKVCNELETKTMKDYEDLYLTCDVLFLADFV